MGSRWPCKIITVTPLSFKNLDMIDTNDVTSGNGTRLLIPYTKDSMGRLWRFLLASIVLVGCIQLVLLAYAPSISTAAKLHHHPKILGRHKKKPEKAVASDIMRILHCSDEEENHNETFSNDDSAIALFCQAAAVRSSTATTKKMINNNNNQSTNHDWCDPNTDPGRKRLFRIWEIVRNQIDDTDLIRRVMGIARGNQYTIMDDRYHVTLWAPPADIGITTVLEELKTDGYGMKNLILPTLRSEAADVGNAKIIRYFVDIGANLGIISLAVALETAMINNITRIVAIEAASPTWLFQQLNLRCNLEDDTNQVISVLAGLDSKPGTLQMTWREHSTTSTRSWTPDTERSATDVELIVPTRTLQSIMEPLKPYVIACAKIDCEGKRKCCMTPTISTTSLSV